MPDEHYQNPKLAALYDLDSPWSIDRDFYLSLAGSTPQKILDLGCGTGLLCDAYAANNHEVTGVDPSPVMLDIARKKPHGEKIEWVVSNAQHYKSAKLFDLIIMTGHAFQVLLNDQDTLDTFSAMKANLKPGGCIVFESRNPKIDWKKEWNYDMQIPLPDGAAIESRRFIAMKKDIMTFELVYKFSQENLTSRSYLRFLSKETIESLLTKSGLYVEKIFGDWDKTTFNEKSSYEMIFIVGAT